VWQSPVCGGFKPEWGLLKVPKMWGVSVPPESPPMKLGGGKVGRNDVHKLHTSYGQLERFSNPYILFQEIKNGGNVEKVDLKVPKELERKVRLYLQELEKRREILKKTAGILKTPKPAKELKVELYEELYG